MSRTEWLVVALIFTSSCAAPDSGVSAGEPRRVDESRIADLSGRPHAVTPDGEAIVLEIARSDAQRARGLMFRESLPDRHGMLFVFAESERHGFWMKNTFIPLDMLWIEDDGTLTTVMRNVPPCRSDPCPMYVPDSPGLYVLELPAGQADRLGLTEGDHLDLRNIEPPNGG